MDKYVGVVFSKEKIDNNLYFFKPYKVVEGTISNNKFITNDIELDSINDYNIENNSEYLYYYAITKNDLKDKYDCYLESDFKLCRDVFFEEVKDYIYFGFKNREKQIIEVLHIHKSNLQNTFKNPIYKRNSDNDVVELTKDRLNYLLKCKDKDEMIDYLKVLGERLDKFKKITENASLDMVDKIEVDSNNAISKISIVTPCEKAKIKGQNVYMGIDSNKNDYRLDIDVDELNDFLSERIYGQDDNLKGIINTIAMNYKTRNPKEIKKALIIGPSGSGKTETFRLIAEYLKVPYTNYSAPDLSAVGYVGKDMEDLLKTIYGNANKDIKMAENGIVFIDEIDKIATKGTKSDNAVNAQPQLLKFLEGHIYDVETRFRYYEKLNTSLMSIFCGGAFEDIELESKNLQIGFGNDYGQQEIKNYTTQDLINYGMKKELIGRLPITYVYNELSKNQLKNILLKSKISPLLIEKARLKRDFNIDLVCDMEYIDELIDVAYNLKTGARSLKGIIDKSLELAEFDLQRKKNLGKYREMLVTKDTVTNNKIYTLKK